MDAVEFALLSSDAMASKAKVRIALAQSGDAEGAAKAFSSCPWLIESQVLEGGRGQPEPGMASALCNHAGADECRLFGRSIAPNPHTAEDFPALVEAYLLHEHRKMFALTNIPLAGSRFANIHQGLDANPCLPKGFGTRLFGRMLRDPKSMLDGLRNAADARWWAQACEAASLSPRQTAAVLATQVGETIEHLIRASRAVVGKHATDAQAAPSCQEIGSRAGEALAILSRGWPAGSDPEAQARWAEHLAPQDSIRQGAALANRIHPDAEPLSHAALEKAVSKLDEPLLASLANLAEGAFALMVERRRVDLGAAEPSANARPMRI